MERGGDRVRSPLPRMVGRADTTNRVADLVVGYASVNMTALAESIVASRYLGTQREQL